MVKDLEKDLRRLNGITPRAEYMAQSRAAILSTPRSFYTSAPKQFGRGVIWESLSLGLSTIMSAAAVLIMLGGATGILRAIVFDRLAPGIDTEGIITEAGAASKDIDVQLNEVQYYNFPAPKTSTALKTSSTDTTPTATDSENPKSSDIDKALDEASK